MTPDFEFYDNKALKEKNKEKFEKFDKAITELEKVDAPLRQQFLDKIEAMVYARTKEDGFENVGWKNFVVGDEIKFNNEVLDELSEECKHIYLDLLVNFCVQIWGHFTYIGNQLKHSEGFEIIENFNRHRD